MASSSHGHYFPCTRTHYRCTDSQLLVLELETMNVNDPSRDQAEAPVEPEALEAEEEGEEVGALVGEEPVEQQADQQADQQQQLQPGIPPPPAMDPFDPRRMEISPEEVVWAHAIKAAVQASPELDPVNDFWCAQLAIVDQDNVESALERVQHLQAFREQYRILDTASDGRKYLHDFVAMFPGYILSVCYDSTTGNYVLISDQAAFDMRILDTKDKQYKCLGSAYYVVTALNPDLEGIRRGVSFLVECESYDWARNMSVNFYKLLWTELLMYPLTYSHVKHFHCGVLHNMLLSLTKRFLPHHIRAKIFTGCQFEERLDTLYLTPTVEAANQRLLARLDESISRRYASEASFQLPPLVVVEEARNGIE